MAGPKLPERIAQCYYSHGLLCSSHPVIAICIAAFCFLLCCFPLLNLPLPGSIPLRVYLPYTQQDIQKPFTGLMHSLFAYNSTDGFAKAPDVDTVKDSSNSSIKLSSLMNETENLPFLWAKDRPIVYVQQIVLKTGVWPWKDELRLSDAFRGPLQEVFRLLEIVQNHQQTETGTSLAHVCFHVENVKRNVVQNSSPLLPEYSCLVLSPANLWQQNIDRFLLDTNILSTVFNHQNLQKGKISMAEMFFGMPLKVTGVKRYPFRARPRVLQYAITLFLHQLDDKYISSLREKLLTVYPSHPAWDSVPINNQITLIYYPGEFNNREFVPLCFTFVGLLVYVYFSVRKLEFIKSKLLLSIYAVMTIAANLIMTVGFCFFFGLTLSFHGKEIFPYLVMLVGMENVFVLTKSVMSVDRKLDVKIRLAQGLSKEGWSITKNLLVEITILTMCLFTFIPAVQHICIFMIVSLLCDFFLQMLFFCTVLGIDIRKNEEMRDNTNEFQLHQTRYLVHSSVSPIKINPYMNLSLRRSKSHPKLNGFHTNVIANLGHQTGEGDKKTPKRILLVKIWARTRFFQRAFVVWMVVWISMIVYNSGIIENIFEMMNEKQKADKHNDTSSEKNTIQGSLKLVDTNESNITKRIEELAKSTKAFNPSLNHTEVDSLYFNTEILNKTLHFISLNHFSQKPWLRVSEFHWSSILAQYNISVAGRYLAILPPILIKHQVTPERAAAIRSSLEMDNITPPSRWRALAAALDPIDLMDFETESGIHFPHVHLQAKWGIQQSPNDIPYYPSSPMEFFFIAILILISVLVIAYSMVVVYRCICTKNYAEWRSSWMTLDKDPQANRPALQFVMEAAPIIVSGHNSEIECLTTSEEYIVSCCLQGQIKVWNPMNGELLSNIDRHMFFGSQNNISEALQCQNIQRIECQSIDDSVVDFSASSERTERLSSNIEDDFLGKRIYADQLFLGSDHHEPNASLHHLQRRSPSVDSRFIGGHQLDRNGSPAIDNYLYKCLMGGDAADDVFVGRFRNKYKRLSRGESSDASASSHHHLPSVWCMDFMDDLIVVGCSNGHLEFWETTTGKFKGIFNDSIGNSINFVKLMEGMSSCGMHLIVARLSGHLELILLETSQPMQQSFKRTHIRTGSAGSIPMREECSLKYSPSYYSKQPLSLDGKLQCRKLASTKAHQQPITGLECDGGKIITGSQDHTLKVFSSYDLSPLYTLHGHCGPITCLFVDRVCPTVSGSGSEDGLLCVWDLMTGTCMYSVQAHDGPISELICSESYVISMGTDEKLCVWERFRGHLLNVMLIGAGSCGMLSLTQSLVLTGGRGGLTVWDASTGEPVRKVVLGSMEGCVSVRKILPLRDAIVCDYANELRIIQFPIVSRIERQFERKND